VPGRGLPTLSQHFLNPGQSHRILRSEVLNDLLCSERRVALPNRTDADSRRGVLINPPAHLPLHRIGLASRCPTVSQKMPGARYAYGVIRPEHVHDLLPRTTGLPPPKGIDSGLQRFPRNPHRLLAQSKPGRNVGDIHRTPAAPHRGRDVEFVEFLARATKTDRLAVNSWLVDCPLDMNAVRLGAVDFNNLCPKFQQLMSQPDRCPVTTYAKTRRFRIPRDRQGANTADDLPATDGRRQATSISALLVDLAARVLSFGPVHPHGAAP
jgi:hypothetical protein